MRAIYNRYSLIFLAAILISLLTNSSAQAREMAAQRECATCHVMWLDTFRIEGAVTLIDNIPMDKIVGAGAAEEEMCYSCHDGFVLDSRDVVWDNFRHPVKVKPSKKIHFPRRSDGTEIFPLDLDGKVYCGTCHTAHGVQWEGKKEDVPIFMRGSNKDSRFCKMCHEGRTGGALKGNHPIDKTSLIIPKKLLDLGAKSGSRKNQVICQSCHVVHGARGRKILAVENDNSRLCGTCHSDRYAADIEDAQAKRTHPVNIKSERIEIPPSFAPDRSKKGTNGEIICETCHMPHNAITGKGILVENNDDSNMCKKCHSDKKSVLITKHNLLESAPQSRNVKGETPARSGPCSACHLPHNGKGPKMWAQEIRGDEDPISNMCKSCHSSGRSAEKKRIEDHSHPVDAPIARAGGESTLPLFTREGRFLVGEERRNGKVLCSSCHDVHQWNWKDAKIASARDAEGDGTNSFLRKAAAPAPDLCADCHRNKKYVIKSDHDMRVTAPEAKTVTGDTVLKAGVCGSCHMIHNAPSKAKMWARELSGKGDIIAQLCTSCHYSGGPAGKKLTGENSHPTGRPVSNLKISISDEGKWDHPYLSQVGSGEAVSLTPLPFFDSEGNRVSSGNVSCGSCHDPHQWDPNRPEEGRGKNLEGDGTNSFLRMSKDPDSALCKNCHVEKRSIAFTKHNLKISSPGDKNIEGKNARTTGICSSCHLPHNGAGPKMWARKPANSADPVERLCKGCHASGKSANKKLVGYNSHPIGKSVKGIGIEPLSREKWDLKENTFSELLDGKPLVALPLYERSGERVADGNISCGSCHDPHQWDPDTYPLEALLEKGDDTASAKKHFSSTINEIKKEEGDGTNSFLRISNAPDSGLCKNCHVNKRPVELSKHNLNISAVSEKNSQGQTAATSGSCSACHLAHNGSAMKMWARPVTGKEDTMSNLCKNCHSKGFVAEKKPVHDYSHPVNADITRADGSTDLPLYNSQGEKSSQEQGGKVVCATCHDPHQWDVRNLLSRDGASSKVEGSAKDSFLRMPAFPSPELCINCHENKKYVEYTDHDLSITAPKATNISGQTVDRSGKCGFCHMVHNSPNMRRLWAVEMGPGDDIMEQLCRSCHLEGRIAANKRPKYFNHPPDIKATSNIIRARKGDKATPMPVYNDEGESARAGLITCPTCHDPHQWSAIEEGYGPGQNTEGNNQNSFLRNVSNLSFCSDCHGFDGLFRYKYYHGVSSRNKNVPITGTGR